MLIFQWVLAALLIFNTLVHTQLSRAESRELAAKKRTSGLPPQISSISVKGNRRIEAAAVIEKMAQKNGQPILYEKIADDIRAIYSLGVFENVSISEEPGSGGAVQLIVHVSERPVINEVKFEGLDRVNKDDLKEAVLLKKYQIYNPSAAADSVGKIRKVYEQKGFYLAVVNYEAQPVKGAENEVDIVFKIRENDKIRVKQITFLGNQVFKDADLKGIMQTKEGGVFSWLTDSGSYKEAAIEQDLLILNYWYYNHGYVQVEIGTPKIYVSPDKRWIYITLTVKEGDQFNIGKIDFGGDMLFSEEELREKLKLETNTTFTSDGLRGQVLDYTAMYGDLGYAFANVVPQTNIRAAEKLVDVTFSFEKGEKVNFGTIVVAGNNRTHDKVVRRELRIREGELYNETNMRKSRENVERLGFFERGIVFNKQLRAGTKDILDLSIEVKERQTGTLTIGMGYSSQGGFLANAQISEENFLGRGQRLAFSGTYQSSASRFNLSFDEPYLLDTEWSLGGDLYRADRTVGNNLGVNSYSEVKFGGDIRVGHPIAEYTRTYFTYKVENSDLANKFNETVLSADVNEGITSSVIASLVRDIRDDRFMPTKGNYQSLSVEYAGLGGNKHFAKFDANVRWFHPLFWKFIFRSNFEYGYLMAIGDRKLPVTERYVLGGPYTLRGYDPLTVGAMVCADAPTKVNDVETTSQVLYRRLGAAGQGPCPTYTAGDGSTVHTFPFVLGGRHKAMVNAEIDFPIFQEVGIRGVLFFDAGNTFDAFDTNIASTDPQKPFNLGDQVLMDWGFGFRWFSPIGPLRFEFGFPLSEVLNGDNSYKFNFTIGPSF